jgi:hypothetical protein
VARKIVDKLGGADLFSISECKDKMKTIDSEIVGLVFPVYIWGVPAPIVRFMNYPAASYGVSKYHKGNKPFAASCGELTLNEIKYSRPADYGAIAQNGYSVL